MRAALLLCVLLFAGCASPSSPPVPEGFTLAADGDRYLSLGADQPIPPLAGDWRPTEMRPGQLSISNATRLDAFWHASEPSMARLPDGTLFVVAIGTADDRPAPIESNVWLWRSQDDGASWHPVFEPDGPLTTVAPTGTSVYWATGDADVEASSDGWVYVLDWWPRAGAPGGTGLLPTRNDDLVLWRSSDAGETWQSTFLTVPPGTGMDRPWLVTGPDGLVGMAYVRFFSGPNSIEAVFSSDHGQTFGAPVVVVPAQDDVFPLIGKPLRTSDGLLALPYAANGHEGLDFFARTDVMQAWSNDNGQTWSQTRFGLMPRGPGHLWPYQGDGDDNRATLAWGRQDGDGMSLWTVSTADGGATWSEGQWLGWGGLHMMPWVSCNGGACVVVWYSAAHNGTAHEMPGDTKWHVNIAYRPSPDAGFWVQQLTDAPVKVGRLCGWGGYCQESRQLLDNFAAEVLDDKSVVVAYAVEVEHEGQAQARVEVRRASWQAA